MKLWKKVSLGKRSGGFVTPVELNGDGQLDLLLSYVQEYSAHLHLVAVDLDGDFLWSYGNEAAISQRGGKEPSLRPPLTAFDFNGDGQTEVVVDLGGLDA